MSRVSPRSLRENVRWTELPAGSLSQHHSSDEKYWAQIRYAQQLLCLAVCISELAQREEARERERGMKNWKNREREREEETESNTNWKSRKRPQTRASPTVIREVTT
eukprot:Skav221940  [mRNA]  locus=scaffold195:378940:379532:+ [translate_table: standard]